MKIKQHNECFFVPPSQIDQKRVLISGNEFRHLQKVKRKRVGDQIFIVDGEGNYYTVRIIQIQATKAVAEIEKTRRLVGESLVEITLAQGLIRSQRMDWLVEKATELGVRKILPVQMDFCQVNSSDLRLARWQRLAQQAMKQCSRSYLPKIENKIKVTELIDKLPKPVIFAHPGVKNSVGDVISRIVKKKGQTLRFISLLVGPEGGFSDEEISQFRQLGYFQVQLGGRRLRSETAAISLIALTLEALGEM